VGNKLKGEREVSEKRARIAGEAQGEERAIAEPKVNNRRY
jgi:hypothetical protein